MAYVSRLTVWLRKGPSIFNLGLLVYFFLIWTHSSGLGLMIFHKVSPRTHHNYL